MLFVVMLVLNDIREEWYIVFAGHQILGLLCMSTNNTAVNTNLLVTAVSGFLHCLCTNKRQYYRQCTTRNTSNIAVITAVSTCQLLAISRGVARVKNTWFHSWVMLGQIELILTKRGSKCQNLGVSSTQQNHCTSTNCCAAVICKLIDLLI